MMMSTSFKQTIIIYFHTILLKEFRVLIGPNLIFLVVHVTNVAKLSPKMYAVKTKSEAKPKVGEQDLTL